MLKIMTNSDFQIEAKSVQTSASYVKGSYKSQIQYLQDKDGNVQNVNMTIYKQSSAGTDIYAGTVNAVRQENGELSFSFSSIAQGDIVEVSSIVEDINSQIAVAVSSDVDDSAGNKN